MKLSIALAAGLLCMAVPRAAHAELWINLDGRFRLAGDINKQCRYQRRSQGMAVYSCHKGDGTLTFTDDDGTVCRLSIWTSGSETWHADISADPKYPKSVCKMRWENDNTLKVYPG